MEFFKVGTAVIVALAFAVVSRAEDRTIIEPVGDKPCEITQKDVVRVTAKGIAGSTIDVKVTGEAKVATKTKVVRRAGGQNEVGSTVEEYDIKPSGAGDAKVIVTVRSLHLWRDSDRNFALPVDADHRTLPINWGGAADRRSRRPEPSPTGDRAVG
jgi:hypothetical protein